jgi:hypothetical protein
MSLATVAGEGGGVLVPSASLPCGLDANKHPLNESDLTKRFVAATASLCQAFLMLASAKSLCGEKPAAKKAATQTRLQGWPSSKGRK